MTDVTKFDFRAFQSKLIEWELTENSSAPLSSTQRDAVLELSLEVGSLSVQDDLPKGEEKNPNPTASSIALSQEISLPKVKNDFHPSPGNSTFSGGKIDSTQQFLAWFSQVEEELEKSDDLPYILYREQLMGCHAECQCLLNQIESSLTALAKLSEHYLIVSNKTNSLHQVSEQLLADQTKLNGIYDSVGKRLNYFTALDRLSNRLNSPTLSVTSETFVEILDNLDECMEYVSVNNKWKESNSYLVKYRQCLNHAVGLIRSCVFDTFEHAMQQVLAHSAIQNKPGDTVFALYYGKFQASAPRVKPIIMQIEARSSKNPEYEQLLISCHHSYFNQRQLLMGSSVSTAINELSTTHKGDHCTLVRSGCAFLVHICHDEHQLFYQFFSDHSPLLTAYLETLCTTLYDVLRPFIIHINHLETLAEVCSILRLEMLEEHVQNNPSPLEAFGLMTWQLLHDVQERLVYRAHCYLHSDILQYKPSAGDLAYPDKLIMMESIAQSLQEQAALALRRSESRSSLASIGSATSQEVARIVNETTMEQPRSRTGNSPADLHGMWYPTVRRVLVCLSRLYRCVDRPIFQGLSQEALTMCIQSVQYAASQISQNKSVIDGELFQIKHLLILREQIAPFQVDFTIKEMSLDFSKVKTAAFGLIQKRKRLFSLGTNNALLEFLLEGTPQVKEQLVDSRKEVDHQLKASCEYFIMHVTTLVAGGISDFVQNSQTAWNAGQREPLAKQTYASAETVSTLVQETQRLIKAKLPTVQRSMQLYLANRETEFILFRPIRNNIVACFGQLYNLLTNGGYTEDDLLVIGCPTQEQVSILLSSSLLLATNPDQAKVNATSPVAEEGSGV